MKDNLWRSGFRVFTIIWAGQLVSTLGTGMTRFALLIWAYQQTGQATTVALLGFFAWMPYVLIGPVAGYWIDRVDRRRVLVFADCGSALATLTVLLFYLTGDLRIWHLFLLEGLTSVFDAFQGPAYTAATTTLVKKEEYARASGMRSVARDVSHILSPAGAGILLPFMGLGGIMAIDLVTFGIAMLTLLPFRLPVPAGGESEGDDSFGARLRIAWKFIFGRRGLVGLMVIFMGIEFLAAVTYFSILPALILARSGGSETAFGLVQAMLGVGGVTGGLIVTVWGLPRRRIHAVLGLCGLSFLLGDMVFALGRSLPMWMAAGFMAAVFIPAIGGGYRTIWQSKTPPHMQGRVFALMGMFQNSVKPLGYLIAGPLADRLLEPAMQPGGALAPLLGGLFGTGSGAGIALMFAMTGILGAMVSFGGYLYAPARRVEQELSDYDITALDGVQADVQQQEPEQQEPEPGVLLTPVTPEGGRK